MGLPFSHAAFLDVFGAYNTALWPVAAVLWIGTAYAAWVWLHRGSIAGRWLYGLLAVHWAWSGVAYHWFYFRPINPIAFMFSLAFVAQAALFTWMAMRGSDGSVVTSSARGVLGLGLVLYGLAYPLMGLAAGLQYPRMPVFAVPCPTALVTAGWLLTAPGAPRRMSLVPALWGLVGGTAAAYGGLLALQSLDQGDIRRGQRSSFTGPRGPLARSHCSTRGISARRSPLSVGQRTWSLWPRWGRTRSWTTPRAKVLPGERAASGSSTRRPRRRRTARPVGPPDDFTERDTRSAPCPTEVRRWPRASSNRRGRSRRAPRWSPRRL